MKAIADCAGTQGKPHLGMPRWAGNGARRSRRSAFSDRRQRREASSCTGCALRTHTRQQECHLADAGSTGPPSPILLSARGWMYAPQIRKLSVTEPSASCSRPSKRVCLPRTASGTLQILCTHPVCCRVATAEEALYPLYIPSSRSSAYTFTLS